MVAKVSLASKNFKGGSHFWGAKCKKKVASKLKIPVATWLLKQKSGPQIERSKEPVATN